MLKFEWSIRGCFGIIKKYLDYDKDETKIFCLWHTWGMNCSSCQRFQKPPACKAPTTESNWVLRAKFFRTGRAEYKLRRVSWPTWKGLYLGINQIYCCWFEIHYPRSMKKVCLKSATNACGMILAAPLSTIAWFCAAWASFVHLTTPLK